MKLQVLTFLQTLIETHRPETIRPYVAALLPAVIACAREDWYKIIAQSLRVVGGFVDVLRPLRRDAGGRNMLADYNGDVDELLGKMFDVSRKKKQVLFAK